MPRKLSITFLTMLFFMTSCAASAYKRVAQTDSPETYRDFIARHPKGTYAQQAKQELERWDAFDDARKINTPEAYREFVGRYPNGETARRARNSIQAFQFLDEARELKKSGKTQEAISRLEKAVAADPDNVAVLTAAGTLALENGNAKYAAAWLKEAVRLNPQDYRARTLLVAASLGSGDSEGAFEEAGAVMKSRPEDVAVRKILGDIFFASGLYEPAAAIYEEAARLSSYEPEIVVSAARANVGAGNAAGALELIAHIKPSSPVWGEAVFLKGESYLIAGDNGRAHESFVEYQSLKPSDPQGFYRDGEALERMGRWNAAIGRYAEASKMDASNASYVWRLAAATLLSGNSDGAKKTFARYLALKPDGNRAAVAKRIVAGENVGFDGAAWGSELAAFKTAHADIKCESNSVETICSENSDALEGGLKGKRSYIFRGGRLVEVRFDARLGDLSGVAAKSDQLIRELKAKYGNPSGNRLKISNVMTPSGPMSKSETAWDVPDGILVLSASCVYKDNGGYDCNLRLTRGLG